MAEQKMTKMQIRPETVDDAEKIERLLNTVFSGFFISFRTASGLNCIMSPDMAARPRWFLFPGKTIVHLIRAMSVLLFTGFGIRATYYALSFSTFIRQIEAALQQVHPQHERKTYV